MCVCVCVCVCVCTYIWKKGFQFALSFTLHRETSRWRKLEFIQVQVGIPVCTRTIWNSNGFLLLLWQIMVDHIARAISLSKILVHPRRAHFFIYFIFNLFPVKQLHCWTPRLYHSHVKKPRPPPHPHPPLPPALPTPPAERKNASDSSLCLRQH